MKKMIYEAPEAEFLDVVVEQGFTASKVESNDFEDMEEVEGGWQ